MIVYLSKGSIIKKVVIVINNIVSQRLVDDSITLLIEFTYRYFLIFSRILLYARVYNIGNRLCKQIFTES